MNNNKPCNYAFIDEQNLYRGVQKLGWKLDRKKLRVYLKEKYNIEKAFIFLGYIPQNRRIYNFLRDIGYELIFKPITLTPDGHIKGNVDVDLTVHTLINIDEYHKALIVSGDGDFYALIKYLISRKKLLRIMLPNAKECSWLLKKFRRYFIQLQDLKKKLQYKK